MVGWAGGSEGWGGVIAEIASEFVGHLIETKRDQGTAYEELWIIVVSRMGLVEADDLEHTLVEHADELPANWCRIWLLGLNQMPPIDIRMPERGASSQSPA